MSEYHEPDAELSHEVRDFHRALTSLKEEIEAVDWYHQRWSCAQDETLRGVLAHNRDEEIEHACMMLEWLRRRSPKWDEQLRKQLFTSGSIDDKEEGAADEEPSASSDAVAAPSGRSDLGLGNLRRRST